MGETEKCRILVGDAIEKLREIPDASVHCVATSPPYYALRDYKMEGQIGLERTPEEYVEKIVQVFREVRRVLHSSGTLWLNLGDSYMGSNQGAGQHNPPTSGFQDVKGGFYAAGEFRRTPLSYKHDFLKPKDLIMIPFRVAIALQADGWWLRSVMPWVKRNSMPESVTDRPSSSLEYVFLLAKSKDYFYSNEAIKIRIKPESLLRAESGWYGKKHDGFYAGLTSTERMGERFAPSSGRNFRNSDFFFQSWQGLWQEGIASAFVVNPQPFPEAHFAVFPEKLVESMIKAGTSEKGCCPLCFEPYVRILVKKSSTMNIRVRDAKKGILGLKSGYDEKATKEEIESYGKEIIGKAKTVGWKQNCTCRGVEPESCVVLDPFMGSGTTGVVALKMRRRFIGIDLNPNYAEMAKKRMKPYLDQRTLLEVSQK